MPLTINDTKEYYDLVGAQGIVLARVPKSLPDDTKWLAISVMAAAVDNCYVVANYVRDGHSEILFAYALERFQEMDAIRTHYDPVENN